MELATCQHLELASCHYPKETLTFPVLELSERAEFSFSFNVGSPSVMMVQHINSTSVTQSTTVPIIHFVYRKLIKIQRLNALLCLEGLDNSHFSVTVMIITHNGVKHPLCWGLHPLLGPTLTGILILCAGQNFLFPFLVLPVKTCLSMDCDTYTTTILIFFSFYYFIFFIQF